MRRNQGAGADFDRDLRHTMQERQADVPHVSGAPCSICRIRMAMQGQATVGIFVAKDKRLDLENAGRGAM